MAGRIELLIPPVHFLPLLIIPLAFSISAPAAAPADSLFAETDALFNRIYACRASRAEALPELARIRERLLSAERSRPATTLLPRRFPLRDYTFRLFDDGRGRGFVGAESFDFFEGNGHKGHPALDLFVHDRNRDCLDDRSGKPVDVLAVTEGIVLCTFADWDTARVDAQGRILRGGNQVYLYSPADGGIWYYAHLKNVSVKRGDRLRAGSPLGTVGRTGANARMKRSPTHLHLMFLRWSKEGLAPENPYSFLRKSR